MAEQAQTDEEVRERQQRIFWTPSGAKYRDGATDDAYMYTAGTISQRTPALEDSASSSPLLSLDPAIVDTNRQRKHITYLLFYYTAYMTHLNHIAAKGAVLQERTGATADRGGRPGGRCGRWRLLVVGVE